MNVGGGAQCSGVEGQQYIGRGVARAMQCECGGGAQCSGVGRFSSALVGVLREQCSVNVGGAQCSGVQGQQCIGRGGQCSVCVEYSAVRPSGVWGVAIGWGCW